jgi:hypothetical protein
VAAGGHVHGGAENLTLNRRGCELYESKPTWGARSHPFYNVKPVLHEPGPINMSGYTSAKGFTVRRGEKLRLDSNYDGRLLHTRVMGIMLTYLAPDPSVRRTKSCKAPSDLRDYGSSVPGRKTAPRFKVPLTGIGPDGKARRIKAPQGRRRRLPSGGVIEVGDRFYGRPNVAVTAGSTINWNFNSNQLHNVTVANGPRGFSSKHLNAGRKYRRKLKTPGTYQLFCALHPVEMTGTVKVTKPSR